MIIATLIGLLTFVLASTVHYLALAHLHRRLNHEARSGLPIVVSGIVGAGLAHLAEAALYATSFTLLDAFDLGGFKGGQAISIQPDIRGSWRDWNHSMVSC